MKWHPLSTANPEIPFVMMGTPNDRRVELFQTALLERGLPVAKIVSYSDILQNKVDWGTVIPKGAIARIESPGKSTDVQQLLIESGGGSSEPLEKGEWRDNAAWYQGLQRALDTINQGMVARSDIRLMNHPGDIALMFDKRACHTYLAERGIPVAPAFPLIQSYNELIETMRNLNQWRVFIKPRYGSSAAGVIAYRVNRDRHMAVSTAELNTRTGTPRLFNTRKLRTYQDPAIIATIVDTLCRDDIQVETWVPKAGWHGKTFDLRIVVINGKVHHRVMRLSHSPITNLHLLNDRADTAALEIKMDGAWGSIVTTCEQIAAAFPQSLYMGIDVAVMPDFRRHIVLEVNAFGDLLPGILHDGTDTYSAEIEAITGKA